VMDAPERSGGNDEGPIPKPLVLTALAGCTGMDVVALLRKEGRTLSSFTLRVVGELSKQAPWVYTSVRVVFEATGDPADEEAIRTAIERSQGGICGVSIMLKHAMPVTWELHYNGQAAGGDAPSQ